MATVDSLGCASARSFGPVTIDGKVVAITGASSGIGEATAALLAERGARLVLGARSPDRLNAVAARLTADGGDVVAKVTDVEPSSDLAELVALATDTYGRLDVLFSNAGIMPVSPFDEHRVDDWEAMVDVNLKGVLFGIAAALPVFRRQGSGHFVNTASTAAFRVTPGQSVYAGTKMAVRAICEGLRQEAGENLRVTIISPGMTATNFAESIDRSGGPGRIGAAPRSDRDGARRGGPGDRLRHRPATRGRRRRDRRAPHCPGVRGRESRATRRLAAIMPGSLTP